MKTCISSAESILCILKKKWPCCILHKSFNEINVTMSLNTTIYKIDADLRENFGQSVLRILRLGMKFFFHIYFLGIM